MSRATLRFFCISAATLGVFASAVIAAGDHDHDHDHETENDHGEASAQVQEKASSPGDAHGHGHEAEASGPVRFQAGRGLSFSEDSAKALGLDSRRASQLRAEERLFVPQFEVEAVVYDSGTPSRAIAHLPFSVVEQVEHVSQAPVSVLGVQRARVRPGVPIELLLALPEQAALGSTVRINLRGSPRRSTVVPRSALFRAATGDFVYAIQEDGWFLRTPVRVGGSDGESFEVIEGLHPGDAVVTTGVDLLWLTELRLTKGGGHGH